jgi:hypothetical protein
MTPADRKELEGAARRLSGEFAGVFSHETVEECVMDSFERLAATATVTGFLGRSQAVSATSSDIFSWGVR